MMLQVQHLETGYGAGAIVNGVNLTVNPGEAVAIVGRNGMGKSTLVKSLMGYLPRSSGSVKLDQDEVLGKATHEIVRSGVAYAPQEEALFADMSVRDNLFSGAKQAAVDKAREALVFDTFPILSQRLDQKAGTLSGGEQKMLLLSRCLIGKPRLLIMDEISAGLQPSIVKATAKILATIRADAETTVLMIEQNVDLCMAVADRTLVMKLGRLVNEVSEKGPTARRVLLDQLAP